MRGASRAPDRARRRKAGRQGLRSDSRHWILDPDLQQDRRATRQGLCGVAAGLCPHCDGQCRGPTEAVGGQILRQYRHRGAAGGDADRARAARRRLDLAELPRLSRRVHGQGRPVGAGQGGVQDPQARRHVHGHRPYGEARTRTCRHRNPPPHRSRRPCAGMVEGAGFRFAARARCSKIRPIRSTSRCSTSRSAATPASSPTSS